MNTIIKLVNKRNKPYLMSNTIQFKTSTIEKLGVYQLHKNLIKKIHTVVRLVNKIYTRKDTLGY